MPHRLAEEHHQRDAVAHDADDEDEGREVGVEVAADHQARGCLLGQVDWGAVGVVGDEEVHEVLGEVLVAQSTHAAVSQQVLGTHGGFVLVNEKINKQGDPDDARVITAV